MNDDNVDDSDPTLRRLIELKADNHVESRARIDAINQSMSPEWRIAMKAELDQLSQAAASPRSKLPKLYALMESFGVLRNPHVSCKAGCSACCRTIPVEISDLEAKHIAHATGKTPAQLPAGRHGLRGFLNTDCPFLVNHQCSIYEHRPYGCRSLAVVDRDALTCGDLNRKLTIANDPRAVPVMMTKMTMFDPLYQSLTHKPNTVWADIRQFFPQATAPESNKG